MPLQSALQRIAGSETAYLHRSILRWSLPFFAALLPIVLLSVLSERMATRSMEQLLQSQQLSLTSSVAQDLTRTFLERTTLVNAVASLPKTVSALEADDRFALQSRLKAVAVAEPSIERALLLSQSGTLVASFPTSASGAQRVSYAAQQWLGQAMKQASPDVTQLYQRPSHGGLTVAAVAPVQNGSGTTVGLLVFEERLEPLVMALRSLDLPAGGSLAVIDHEGNLVAHTATASLVPMRPFAAFTDDAFAGGIRTVRGVDPVSGRASSFTFVPVTVGRGMWAVVASQDLQTAFRDLARLRAGLFAAGAALTLLTFAFVVGLARTQAHNMRLNRMLEAKNQELREVAAIVGSSFDPIIGLTLEGVVRTWNPAAERLYMRSEQEMVGRPFAEALPAEKREEFAAWMNDAVRGKTIAQTETVRRRRDATDVPVSVTLTPVCDADGKVMAVSCVERDITAQKEIEKMKDDFISFVSHQLKAPVTATRWTIEGMLDGDYGPVSDAMKEPLNQLHDVSTQNFALISSILNLSRIDRGVIELERKPQELRAVAERAMRDYRIAAQKAGLSLTLEAGDRPVMVDVDLEKMAEAVTNAISNAIKHTKQGGITLRLSTDGVFGVIDVVDTGEGMTQDMLSRLFTRAGVKGSNTQAASSSGLGLYIAKHFMELQGGDISVTSEQGKGSVFRYRIPLAVAPQ